jgi:hypothetical protein
MKSAIIVTLVLLPVLVFARGVGPRPTVELVREADVIAVVNITSALELAPDQRPKGFPHQYRFKVASGQTTSVISGALSNSVQFLVPFWMPCEYVTLNPGQYVVCLQRKSSRLVNLRFRWSILPIKDNMIEWRKLETKDDGKKYLLTELISLLELKKRVRKLKTKDSHQLDRETTQESAPSAAP